MGDDSISLERSLWIRNVIADIMLEECKCHLYNLGVLDGTHYKCLRCDNLQRANRLWPVEYAIAIENIKMWDVGGDA